MRNMPEMSAALFSLDRRKSTVLRGFAILLVLLGHMGYYFWGGAGGVALFLLLSGYGLDRSFEEKGLEGYWQKRILKVWLPYCVIGLFNVLIFWPLLSGRRILSTIVGLDIGNADPTMWYISYILLWYAAYYLAARISLLCVEGKRRKLIRIALLFLCCPLFWMLAKRQVWHEACGAELYVVFFPLGVVLSALSQIQVREWIRRLVWCSLFFLAAVYMVREYSKMWTTLMALAIAFQVLAPSQLMQIHGRAERMLLWLGKYSYPIYLIEGTMLVKREEWLPTLFFQPLINLVCILLTALFAFAFWEAYRQLEDLLTASLEKRRALRRNRTDDTEDIKER